MELTNAINILQTITTNKQQEIDAIKLAISILSDKFQPELTRTENAEKQVQDINAELQAIKNTLAEKESELVQKTPTVTSEEQIIQ